LRGHTCKDRSPCRTSQSARILRRQLPVRPLSEVKQWVWVADPAKDVETRTTRAPNCSWDQNGLHVQVQIPARGRGSGNGERITPGHSDCVSAEWSSGGQTKVQEAAGDPGCATAAGIDAKATVVPGYSSAARGDGRGLTHLLRQAAAERIRNWDTSTRLLKQHSGGRKAAAASLHRDRGACILTQTSMHCGRIYLQDESRLPATRSLACLAASTCPEPGNRYLEWRNCRRPLPSPAAVGKKT
jgi:hypothetical protein